MPQTAEELAAEGRAAVEAGAQVLHLHPYDASGAETFAADVCAAALTGGARGVPGRADLTQYVVEDRGRPCPAPGADRDLDRAARALTANQGEAGNVELCEHLADRGVGIEAGLLSLADAHDFVLAGIANRCVRVLIEPLDADPGTAVDHAAAMEQAVVAAGIDLEQVHHGDGIATWAVMERGVTRGHGTRVGLEDTTVLPDGRSPAGNGELVRAAAAMLGA